MIRFYCSLLFVLIFVSLTNCIAQSTDATISGIVTDSGGKRITGADVDIVNDETGNVFPTKTNSTGLYALAVIPPGHYHVQVSMRGFKTLIKPDVVLYVQSAMAINFTLPVGATSESVTVDAAGQAINTTDGSVSTVIDRNFVENMPLNGRSFQALLTLAPGVAQTPTYSGVANGAGISGEIVVNGQRAEANQYMVDGVSANVGAQPTTLGFGAGVSGNAPGVTALGSTQSLVSVDDLQEFRSSTSSYSAEYGRTPGGAFSFSTRSGTNELHGSIYDYFRNDALDANNWFNDFYDTAKGKERQNDFGGTIGGALRIPGRRDSPSRTFYFVAYEGLRLKSPQATAQYIVPDSATRAQASASIQPLLNSFPVADYGINTSTDGFASYLESVSYPSNIDSGSIRVDHTFSGKFSIFGRFADSPSGSTTYTGAVQNSLRFSSQSLTLGATYALTPHQTNELRFSRIKADGTTNDVSTNLGGAVPFPLSSLPGPNNVAFPGVGSDFYTIFTFAANTTLTLGQQPLHQIQYNITDAHSLTVGRHNLKAGIDWRRTGTLLIPQNPNEEFTYSTLSQVLSNTPSSATAKVQAFQDARPIYLNFSAYLQDEWRISDHLAASLGVRWDVNPAPTDAIGPGPYTITESTNLQTVTLAPRGASLWKTDWLGFAPRLGLAYQLHPGSAVNTVFRLGGGLFYDTGNADGSVGYSGIGYSSSQKYTSASFPLTSGQLTIAPPAVSAPYTGTVYGFDPDLRLPYTVEYNLAIEQQLSRHDSLTTNYVGSAGRRLLTTFYTTPALIGNPNFANGTELSLVSGRASSDYNSLQAKYQRQLSSNLQALVSYTWSHSIDDASSNFTEYQLLRASSDFDIRQNLQGAITYQTPIAVHGGAWKNLMGGFGTDLRIQAHSGPPINIEGSGAYDQQTGVYTAYTPSFVPGIPVYLYGSAYPGGRILNYAAFTSAGLADGNVPRNFGKGFGAAELDSALRKEIALRDHLKLQFRAEAFNIFNHPMFGAVYSDTLDGAALFGRAYNTLNASLGGGLNSLYQAGGPRSLQLSLRVSF